MYDLKSDTYVSPRIHRVFLTKAFRLSSASISSESCDLGVELLRRPLKRRPVTTLNALNH